jgi:hypothetical protein
MEFGEREQESFHKSKIASIHDLAMIDESRPNSNPLQTLVNVYLTGSQKPEEYLPRGAHKPKDKSLRMRLAMDFDRIFGGFDDNIGSALLESIWLGDMIGLGMNGAARQEVITALNALAHMERRPTQGRQGGEL